MPDTSDAEAYAPVSDDALVAPTEAPAIAQPVTIADRVSAAVFDWFRNSMSNSPISRDAASWAHVEAALPALTATILKEV